MGSTVQKSQMCSQMRRDQSTYMMGKGMGVRERGSGGGYTQKAEMPIRVSKAESRAFASPQDKILLAQTSDSGSLLAL